MQNNISRIQKQQFKFRTAVSSAKKYAVNFHVTQDILLDQLFYQILHQHGH